MTGIFGRSRGGITSFTLLSWLLAAVVTGYGQNLSAADRPIVVAIDREYAPYEFVNEAGEVSGFIPALLQEFALRTGRRITFLPMAWPDAVAALQNSRVDLISMIKTPERQQQYAFSQPHSAIAQAIFRSPKAAGIHDLASLAGHKVALQEHDLSDEKLADRADFTRRRVASKEEGFLLLQSGEVDAFLAAEQAGIRFVRRYGLQEHIELAAVGLFPQEFCFAARQGNHLLIGQLDQFIASSRSSGRYAELYLEWFGDGAKLSWLARHQGQVVGGISGLAGAILIVMIWNILLRRTVVRQTAALCHSNALIRERENHTRLLLDSTAEAIYGLDLEGRCTFCNAAFLRQFGFQTENDLLGQVVHNLIHHSYPDGSIYPETKCQAHRALLLGAPTHADHEIFFRADGSSFPVEYWSHPILQEGVVTGTVVTLIDITERRQAAAAIKESEERYRTLVDNIDLGITLIDRHHQIVMINKAQAGLFHKMIDDFTGKFCFQEFEKRPDICDHCPGVAAVANGVASEVVSEGIRDDGSRFTVRIRAFPLSGSENLAGSFIEVVEDITEQKKLQDELERHRQHLEEEVVVRTEELDHANQKLQELDRLKSMFIASMSHELRTPLNSIIGFSSILLNEWVGPVSNEQEENLAIILRSGKHLLSLINDVIDVSKVEAGMLETRSEDFALREVVSEAVSAVAKEARDKGLALEIGKIDQDMHSDRRRLLQCLLNLLSNAVKFTEAGTVRVQAHLLPGGEAVELSVEDTGIGIAEEDLPKLFQPFVRLDSPMKIKVPGTGLGLYLTRKLATEILKGDTLCLRNPAQGSRFILRLPVRI